VTGDPTVHASAVLVGDRAVLIRGPSGAGKSRLAFDLVLAGQAGQIPPAILVGDDRVHLEARDGKLRVRPAAELAGLIEIHGLGIRGCDFVREAIVGLVVDLAAPDAQRLPTPEALAVALLGVKLPRMPVKAGFFPLSMVVAKLTTTEGYGFPPVSADCPKGIGNHIRHSIATD
jgi:serine kinase of HPr protein (carbohydrate metabolism regulator)